MFVVFQLII